MFFTAEGNQNAPVLVTFIVSKKYDGWFSHNLLNGF
jgi:hypothetical protein